MTAKCSCDTRLARRVERFEAQAVGERQCAPRPSPAPRRPTPGRRGSCACPTAPSCRVRSPARSSLWSPPGSGPPRRSRRARWPPSGAPAARASSTAVTTNSRPISAPVAAAAGGPRRRRSGQPSRRQLTGDAPHDQAGEGQGAAALHDRRQQHGSARHRSRHQMAHVAGLERDRPAVAAAAQAEGERRHGEQPDDGRAAVEHVGQLRGGGGLVAHEAAQPGDGETAGEGGEVHAVGDLEPLELTEPSRAAGSSELAHRRCCCHAAHHATGRRRWPDRTRP